jgi:hypothetical protein
MFEKTKKCAGSFQCRFKIVLRVLIVLTFIGIIGAFTFAQLTRLD